MGRVVPAEGAYALALEERADVAADLVNLVGLFSGDDVQEHGFEADDGGGVVSVFGLGLDHDWKRGREGVRPRVPQHILSDVGHILGRDSPACLKEGELVLYDPKLTLSDAEVLGHEVKEGIHWSVGWWELLEWE